MSELYSRDNYSSPFNYIISKYIREYDISKANINILLSMGFLSEYDYNRLFHSDRLTRQIEIGNYIRDNKDAGVALKEGLIKYRKLFFEANGIEDIDVLSVKRDAIFLINKVATNTRFDNVEFLNKNVFTSYYKINNRLELYYYRDMINNVEAIDVKGIDDTILHVHNEYFLDFLKYLFECAQTQPVENVLQTLNGFYYSYKNMLLDIGYYREFNALSKYRFLGSNLYSYIADVVEQKDKYYLDISVNREILETLHSYYSNIYLSTKSQTQINRR